MNGSEEKFFEELARMGHAREGHRVDESVNEGHVIEPEPDEEEDIPVATLAKARAAKKEEKEPEEGQLTIDVYQTPDTIVIESAIAAVRPEDLDIDVSADSVTIRGERVNERNVSEDDYLYQECYWGRFSRSVILPQEIDPEKATVSLKQGILTITLPKTSRKKSKKLKVDA
jgi:HSP20 family protein